MDNVRELLYSFEVSSGQKVNITKFFIFFSTNVELSRKNEICGDLDM